MNGGKLAWLAATISASASTAMAHPGHAHDGGVLHLVLHTVYWGVPLAAALVATLVVWRLIRPRQRARAGLRKG